MSESNHELVVITTPYDMATTEFKSALDRRQANRQALLDWIRKSLVEDIDYGRIHVVGKSRCGLGNKCTNPNHFSKPSLFKPGSEKLLGMMGAVPRFKQLNEYIQAALQGVELRYVILHCELHNSAGDVLADGVGARSLVQDGGDVNKMLKMAAKSAMIDACLRLGGLSELFTQDIEDGTPPKDDDSGEPVYLVNLTQLKKTYARMKGYDLPIERVAKWCKAKFGVEKIEDLTHDQWLVLDEKLEAFAETVKSERMKEPISADQLRKVVSFALQHTLDLTDVLRKIGINSFGELTGANVDALWKALECKAERKALQNENSPPVVQVIPGSEADLLLERAKQIRTAAKYSDGQNYYRDLEEAQNLEAAARKLLIEAKSQAQAQAVGDAS